MKTKIFYDVEATSVSRDADIISIGLLAVTEDKINIGDIIPEGFSVAKVWKGGKCFIHQLKTFYAEFTDFNIDFCDDWVKENVIGKLTLKNTDYAIGNQNDNCWGDTNTVKKYLTQWLSQFESIEFWADYDVIDKPMLIDLIADWENKEYCNYTCWDCSDRTQEKIDECTYDLCVRNCHSGEYKVGLPKHLPNIQYYDFYDLHTMFKLKSIDPDISRELFACGERPYPIPAFIEGDKHNALFDAYIAYLCYQKLNTL